MGDFGDFMKDNQDDYEQFARMMDAKMKKAEEWGLESISNGLAMTELDLFGVGIFYDPDKDEDGKAVGNSDNRRFHVGAQDTIGAMKFIEDYIWQRRMKDFAFGVTAFMSQVIKDVRDKRTPADNQILEHVTHLMEDEGIDSGDTYEVCLFIMQVVMSMMMSDSKTFSMMYKQVVEHEEPQMIALGYPQSIASIIEGYKDADPTDMRHPSNMDMSLTDEDIQNFLKEVMPNKKNNKKNEEE